MFFEHCIAQVRQSAAKAMRDTLSVRTGTGGCSGGVAERVANSYLIWRGCELLHLAGWAGERQGIPPAGQEHEQRRSPHRRYGPPARQPAGPWTPAVHALLGHLHAVGFHSAHHGRWVSASRAWTGDPHLHSRHCRLASHLPSARPGDHLCRVDVWSASSTTPSRVTGRRPMPGGKSSSPPREPASSPITTRPLEPHHRPALMGRSSTGTPPPRIPAPGCRHARLRAPHRQPPASPSGPRSPDTPVRRRLRPQPGAATAARPHASPPGQRDARLPRRAGSHRHPATDPALAARPPRRLASRHRIHHPDSGPVAAGTPGTKSPIQRGQDTVGTRPALSAFLAVATAVAADEYNSLALVAGTVVAVQTPSAS